jgi:hypothetical protein
MFVYLDKKWLDLQYNNELTKKPDGLESEMEDPPGSIDEQWLCLIQGSIIEMALSDALGAHVEFRPYDYMVSHLVKDFEGGGGTLGTEKRTGNFHWL